MPRMRIASRDTVATRERPGRKPGKHNVVALTPMPDFMRGDAERTPCAAAPDFFVHSLSGKQAAHRTRVAKKICEGCDFRAECAAWAIKNPRAQGVWGGTTDQSRAATRRRRAVA